MKGGMVGLKYSVIRQSTDISKDSSRYKIYLVF